MIRRGDEIEEQLGVASDCAMQGGVYPGMGYAEGVEAALTWALGHTSDPPIDPVDLEGS